MKKYVFFAPVLILMFNINIEIKAQTSTNQTAQLVPVVEDTDNYARLVVKGYDINVTELTVAEVKKLEIQLDNEDVFLNRYKFTHKKIRGDVKSLNIANDKVTDNVRELLNKAAPGDELIFNEIDIEGPFGMYRLAEGLTILVK